MAQDSMRALKQARPDRRLDQFPAQQRFPASQPASQNQSGIAQRMGGNQNLLRLLTGYSAPENSRQFEHEAEQASRSPSRPAQLSSVPSKHGARGNEALSPSQGESLDGKQRKQMEARFQTDFGGVRVHNGHEAAELNEQLQARAFTVGQDIYFGRGEYRPDTPQGGGLLAHELAHTIQQRSGDNVVQMQPKGSGASSMPPTAQGIFGMRQLSRVVFHKTMGFFAFSILAAKRPDIAAQLNAIDEQQATVTVANDKMVTVALDKSVTLPAAGGGPDVTYYSVTVTLSRAGNGLFDFGISWTTDAEGKIPGGSITRGLSATQEGESYILSQGAARKFRITPASGPSGEATIEAYTGMEVPETADVMSVSRLPDAPDGSAEQKKALEKIAKDASTKRAGPRQDLSLGIGLAHGAMLDPLFTASWTYRFRLSEHIGSLFQIPIEAEIMYAPGSSVLGALSTGAHFSLSDLKIPVNVRVVGGFGGGTFAGPEKATGARPNLGVVGPIVGGGLGYGSDWFRVEIRAEHLFNIVRHSPNIDTTAVRMGGVF